MNVGQGPKHNRHRLNRLSHDHHNSLCSRCHHRWRRLLGLTGSSAEHCRTVGRQPCYKLLPLTLTKGKGTLAATEGGYGNCRDRGLPFCTRRVAWLPHHPVGFPASPFCFFPNASTTQNHSLQPGASKAGPLTTFAKILNNRSESRRLLKR